MEKSKLNLPLPLPLYRGIATKGTQAGKMVYGSALISTVEAAPDITIAPTDIDEAFSIAPETLGMYIGKEDMNGKNIFTDDVLTDGNGDYVLVYYHKKTCSIGLFTTYNRLPSIVYISMFEFEVIGNIHEKPELLRLFPHLQR